MCTTTEHLYTTGSKLLVRQSRSVTS